MTAYLSPIPAASTPPFFFTSLLTNIHAKIFVPFTSTTIYILKQISGRPIVKKLALPLIAAKLDTKPPAGESVEAWARDQRYSIFREYLQNNELLMTAQHADDQAETILMQLLRGSGPKGLSAMAQRKKFGRGTLVRPFLDKSKQDLLDYARQHQLTWVQDHSNFDTQFDRNFLREDIIPLLKKRWPRLEETLSRSARHCAEQESLLQALLQPIYHLIAGTKPGTLSIKALLQHSFVVQRALIRHWLDDKQVPMPGHKKFDKIFEDLIPARPDAQPQITWGEVCIRRYRDDLYALRLDDIKAEKTGTKKSFQKEGIPPWERVIESH
jgi:tRNA(Ile)-lysidine synthase